MQNNVYKQRYHKANLTLHGLNLHLLQLKQYIKNEWPKAGRDLKVNKLLDTIGRSLQKIYLAQVKINEKKTGI